MRAQMYRDQKTECATMRNRNSSKNHRKKLVEFSTELKKSSFEGKFHSWRIHHFTHIHILSSFETQQIFYNEPSLRHPAVMLKYFRCSMHSEYQISKILIDFFFYSHSPRWWDFYLFGLIWVSFLGVSTRPLSTARACIFNKFIAVSSQNIHFANISQSFIYSASIWVEDDDGRVDCWLVDGNWIKSPIQKINISTSNEWIPVKDIQFHWEWWKKLNI